MGVYMYVCVGGLGLGGGGGGGGLEMSLHACVCVCVCVQVCVAACVLLSIQQPLSHDILPAGCWQHNRKGEYILPKLTIYKITS